MGLLDFLKPAPAKPTAKAKGLSQDEIEALKKSTKLKEDYAEALEADAKVEQRLYDAKQAQAKALKGMLEE